MFKEVNPEELLVIRDAAKYLGFGVTTFKNYAEHPESGFPEPFAPGIWVRSELSAWYHDVFIPHSAKGQSASSGGERSRMQRPVSRGLRRAG